MPESRPKGGTALINMFEPALASLSLSRTALACTGPLKLDAPFPLCRQVGKGRDVPKNQLLVLLSRSGFSRRASATLARSEEVFFVAPGPEPPWEAPQAECWLLRREPKPPA